MDYLLPGSISIFIAVLGFIMFKKFIKFVILVSLIVGGFVFLSQDAFAGGISDFLSSKTELESTKSGEKLSRFVMVQNDDGTIFIFKRKNKYKLGEISKDNNVVLLGQTVKYNLGEISSDATIKKMIKVLFGDPELLNVEDEEDE